jgi:hypothetical protein
MRWAQHIPAYHNPLVHPNSPRNCAVRGDFMFMGPLGTRRGCAIPVGKAVVLSFVGFECSTAESNGATVAKLRACAYGRFLRMFNRFVYRFSLTVDGHRMTNPRHWAYTFANRTVSFPSPTFWGALAGRTKTVTRGLLCVAHPFQKGEHVIEARGKDWQSGKFQITYRFTVAR